MYDNVTYLRTDFKRYISYLKRETNITKISNYYNNIDNLSPEKIKEFKNLITNEIRYNKKYITYNNNNQERVFKNIKKRTQEVTNNNNLLKEPKEENIPLFLSLNLLNVTNNQTPQNSKTSEEKDLKSKIERYLSLYQFSEITSYEGNIFKKCAIFFKNIPKYRFNRKIINYAERDYNIYYHGDDLANFINYLKKYNSIQLALELIFKKSSLSKREVECLFDHNKCVDWINEFCNHEKYFLDNNPKLIRTK